MITKNYVYRFSIFNIKMLLTKKRKLNLSLFFMKAVSELINNRRKLVRDVACLTAEGRLLGLHHCSNKAIF